MKVLVVLLLFVFAFGQECMVCDFSCGDWSCIRDCSSATFDAPRCLVDRNGNGRLDSCSELPLCLTVHGRLVCPDSDKLCTSTEWVGPREFGGAVYYFSDARWSYSDYVRKLSEFSLTCPEVPTSSDDRHRFLTSESPVWVCGGALYPDVWLSFDSCSYVSYDGATWRVKGGDCSNPNKVWQKVEVQRKCYPIAFRHVITDGSQRHEFNWQLPAEQSSFRQRFVVGRFTIELTCHSSTNVFDESGRAINVCTTYKQEVWETSSPDVRQVYYWNVPLNACSYSNSQDTIVGRESLTLSGYGEYREVRVIEERRNDVNLTGVGIDAQRRDCGKCDTTLAGLLRGGTEEVVELPQDSQVEDFQCLNPRFFPGQARRCRAGGLTIWGASCCGISGMFKDKCSREEKELKKRREAGLCRQIGEYCSRRIRLGFIRVCIEKTRSYCCFNSQLARLIHECGRPQVGKGWGDARNPDCSGFSLKEFENLDLSDPACVAAIESWVQNMASRIGDRVGEEIAQRATNSIQSWLNDMKNQKGYGR